MVSVGNAQCKSSRLLQTDTVRQRICVSMHELPSDYSTTKDLCDPQ
jgi:hypothetical protein